MIPTDLKPADWPERIYYVCNSSYSAIVNVTPIIHAGANRIAGMQVFCGVQSSKKTTPFEDREAVFPADRLENFARARKISVSTRHYADPDSFAAWSAALREAIREAKAHRATLVYNVTGGTKDMNLGALLGLSQKERESIMVISVSKRERACLQLSSNYRLGSLEVRRLRRDGKIDLHELLEIYGYVETNKRERILHERFIRENRYIGDRVFSVLKNINRRVLGALHHSVSDMKRLPCKVKLRDLEDRLRTRKDAKSLGNISADLRRLAKAFQGLGGLEVEIGIDSDSDHISIESEEARGFVGGIWLEAVIFGMAEDVFVNSRANLSAGLRLAVARSRSRRTGSPAEDMEVDVGILIDDQLHAVEVKAITTAQNFGQYSPKLIKLRDEIGSHGMKVFLVTPFLKESDIGYEGFEIRSKKQGVTLLWGWPDPKYPRRSHAIGTLREELEKML